jgi:hypothetical protein
MAGQTGSWKGMSDMTRRWMSFFALVLWATIIIGGCVERRLTINTAPAGATVILNDQDIGTSPVTVPFNWYGDYSVRISKDGYETLDTHRKLNAPLHDHFPLDFFVQILYPGRIVDSYEWSFELAFKEYPTRDELIEAGQSLRNQLEQRSLTPATR